MTYALDVFFRRRRERREARIAWDAPWLTLEDVKRNDPTYAKWHSEEQEGQAGD